MWTAFRLFFDTLLPPNEIEEYEWWASHNFILVTSMTVNIVLSSDMNSTIRIPRSHYRNSSHIHRAIEHHAYEILGNERHVGGIP